MPTRRSLSALVLSIACTTSACLGTGHSVNAYGGKRYMNANDWNNVDSPTVNGLDAVLAMEAAWLGIEGGWFHSEEESSTFPAELTIDEYFVGLRVTPWKWVLEPYASLGLSHVNGTEDAVIDDDEKVLGKYARLGAAFMLGPVRMGLDGRFLFGSDVDFNDAGDTDLDNYQVTAFLGLGF